MMRVAVIPACILVTAGCDQLIGADDYHIMSDPSAGALGRSECGGCLDKECSAEQTACNADPTCADAMQCELGCKTADVACESVCAGRFEAGLRGPEYWSLLTCRAQHCQRLCGLPCNGVCTGNEGCDACLSTQCSDSASPMVQSKESTSRLQCEATTFGLAYGFEQGACDVDHAEDEAPYVAWFSCFTGLCGSKCPLPSATPDWGCVGEIPREGTGRTDVDFEVRVNSDLNSMPAVNFAVRPCSLGSGICADPAAVTDAFGIAHLHVQRFGLSFFDYLEITDPDGLTDPTYFVPYPPLLQGAARLMTTTLPKQTLDDFYSTAGQSFDRQRYAHVQFMANSCGIVGLASGLSFESSLGGMNWYLSDSFVAQTDLTETKSTGSGGFSAVPPGSGVGTFTARRTDTNEIVASFQAPVRAGYATYIYFRPSPVGGW